MNRNAVPFDPRPRAVSSGRFKGRRAELSERTAALAERYPLSAGLAAEAVV